jgi:hypothetical protein
MTVLIAMRGELTVDRVERAADFAEAMYASEVGLVEEQGGSPLGLDPEMAKHARELAVRLERGEVSAIERSWLAYIVEWYEQEERACLSVGLDYRAGYRAMQSAASG